MVKTYKIEVEIVEGKMNLRRINDGFTIIELLGLLELAQFEIMETLRGNVKPDYVKREVIIDDKELK